jgi:hypothetical protein
MLTTSFLDAFLACLSRAVCCSSPQLLCLQLLGYEYDGFMYPSRSMIVGVYDSALL